MTNIDLTALYGYDVTNETLNANGFYKVSESGGTFVTVVYFNPETNEDDSLVARDYDYADKSRDNDSIYYAPINEELRREWKHRNGAILDGDKVEIVKGRKLPKGTIHTVAGRRPILDRYGRRVCEYLVFTDGLQTNIANCKRIA